MVTPPKSPERAGAFREEKRKRGLGWLWWLLALLVALIIAGIIIALVHHHHSHHHHYRQGDPARRQGESSYSCHFVSIPH